MAMVVGEMRRDAETPAQRRDAAILAAQIEACRQALSNLRAAAGHARAEGGGPERLDAFVRRWSRGSGRCGPTCRCEARWDGPLPAPEIFADQSLRQSLLILLNNAADASPHRVDVDGPLGRAIALQLDRRRPRQRRRARPPRQAGPNVLHDQAPGQGTGLGLVLTASTVGRLGGTVRWSNRADGGLARRDPPAARPPAARRRPPHERPDTRSRTTARACCWSTTTARCAR